MFASLDEMKMEANNSLEGIDPQEFFSLISCLVRTMKGVEVELTEADVLVETEEFRKMYRQEVQRLLGYYEKRR